MFNVKLVKGVNGKIEDGSVVSFRSPRAIDKERHRIYMYFSGRKKFLSVRKNRDNSFTIKVKRSRLPKRSRSYPVLIRLRDNRGARQYAVYRVMVKVKYIDKKKKAEKAAKKKAEEAKKKKTKKGEGSDEEEKESGSTQSKSGNGGSKKTKSSSNSKSKGKKKPTRRRRGRIGRGRRNRKPVRRPSKTPTLKSADEKFL